MSSALHGVSPGSPVGMHLLDRIDASSTIPFRFRNIPQTYKHLKIIGSVRDPSANVHIGIRVTFNEDGGTNYAYNYSWTDNTTFTASASNTIAYILWGRVLANSVSINAFTAFELTIPNYANTTTFKSCFATWQGSDADTSAGQAIGHGGGVWQSTAAINIVRVWSDVGAGDFVANSTMSLYGLL